MASGSTIATVVAWALANAAIRNSVGHTARRKNEHHRCASDVGNSLFIELPSLAEALSKALGPHLDFRFGLERHRPAEDILPFRVLRERQEECNRIGALMFDVDF